MPHSPRTSPRPSRRPARPAFTLVEMLVVVGIVVILVTITLGVGRSVVEGGRKRATEGVLRALDQTLDIYIEQKGEIPPALVPVPPSRLVGGGPIQGQTMYYPMIDGVVQTANGAPLMAHDSVGVYMIAAEQVPEIQSLITGIDQRFVQHRLSGAEIVRSGGGNTPDASSTRTEIEMTSFIDAWGNPIRIVHPRFDGTFSSGQFGTLGIMPTDDGSDGYFTRDELPMNRFMPIRRIRRLAPTREQWAQYSQATIDQEFVGRAGDADGGVCPSPRPYFYSAGPDGDPATTEDNVYTVRPRFESRN